MLSDRTAMPYLSRIRCLVLCDIIYCHATQVDPVLARQMSMASPRARLRTAELQPLGGRPPAAGSRGDSPSPPAFVKMNMFAGMPLLNGLELTLPDESEVSRGHPVVRVSRVVGGSRAEITRHSGSMSLSDQKLDLLCCALTALLCCCALMACCFSFAGVPAR